MVMGGTHSLDVQPTAARALIPTRAQRQIYEQTPDLDRRRRLRRLVLLPLHMGYDSSSPGEYGCRAHLQPGCARGLRETLLRPQRARRRIITRSQKTSFLNTSGTPKSPTKSDFLSVGWRKIRDPSLMRNSGPSHAEFVTRALQRQPPFFVIDPLLFAAEDPKVEPELHECTSAHSDRTTKYGTFIVLAHVLVNIIHGATRR